MIPRFGAELRRIRRSRGMTQRSMAEQLMCSISYISEMEREHTKFGCMDTLRGISRALNVDLLALLPSWILSCGGAYLHTEISKPYKERMGRDGMRISLLALLVRNWGRLTENDLKKLISTMRAINKKWAKCDREALL